MYLNSHLLPFDLEPELFLELDGFEEERDGLVDLGLDEGLTLGLVEEELGFVLDFTLCVFFVFDRGLVEDLGFDSTLGLVDLCFN